MLEKVNQQGPTKPFVTNQPTNGGAPEAREQEFTFLAPAALIPSPHNPRRHIPPRGIDEFAKDLRQHGVLEPLLVRPMPGKAGKYEILAGERRYLAAKQAGLPDVPVRIFHVSDEVAYEIMVVENLQREDVHPLDEALGYKALLNQGTYDKEKIAAKVAKTLGYIERRLKLADLIPKAQKAFLDGAITLSHAELVARLQPVDQEQALKHCIQKEWAGPGQKQITVTVPVARLRHWIDQNVMLHLSSAPWKKEDPDLVPAAGPCSSCPKRTLFNRTLFDDVKQNLCTDPACFEKKLTAFVVRKEAELAAAGQTVIKLTSNHYYSAKKVPEGLVRGSDVHEIQKGQGACPHTATGIYVEGRQRGEIKNVCTDKTCKTHGHTPYRYVPTPEEKARKEKEARALRLERTRTRRIWDALAEKINRPLRLEEWRIVAERFFARLHHEDEKRIFKLNGWEPKKNKYGGQDFASVATGKIAGLSDVELGKFLCLLVCVQEVEPTPYFLSEDKYLTRLCQRFGVNTKVIDRRVKAEFAEKQKAKRKAKTAGERPARAAK